MEASVSTVITKRNGLTQVFPFHWPANVDKTYTKIYLHKSKLSYTEAELRLEKLTKNKATSVEIHSNVLNGRLLGDESGICVGLTIQNQKYQLYSDKYWYTQDNLAEIVSYIELWFKAISKHVKLRHSNE